MAEVLVVEDDELSLMLVGLVMEQAGHRVTAARSAEEASDLLTQLRPALVIVDVRLPGEDGLTLTRRLKAKAETAVIPVVAITAHARPEDRKAALAAGCAEWLTKPVDTRLLRRTVSQLIDASTA